MIDIKTFCSKIPDFFSLDSGSQIKHLVYFLQNENKLHTVKPKEILNLFNELHINSYSNIPSYLNRNSTKGLNQQFLKNHDGYRLISSLKEKIDKELNQPIELKPGNSLFPLTIFKSTRKYLEEFSNEATCSYEYGLYNSSLFMLRKITETLIIEMFESKGLQAKIKNANGDYFQLSDLIGKLIGEQTWKLSKIVKENLPKIKLLADSSVHSKRFSAKKPDIDEIKTNVRIIFEELVSHINYPKWNSV